VVLLLLPSVMCCCCCLGAALLLRWFVKSAPWASPASTPRVDSAGAASRAALGGSASVLVDAPEPGLWASSASRSRVDMAASISPGAFTATTALAQAEEAEEAKRLEVPERAVNGVLRSAPGRAAAGRATAGGPCASSSDTVS
jgi:hypothetical protein